MLSFHRLRTLWRNLRDRERIERDLDDEVRTAFDLLVDEHVSAGASLADARRAATLQLGHPESIKTHVRTIRAGAWWDAFVQDVRYGTRLLSRDPLFTLTAALSLAICIGANTTVFTIANRLLFRGADGVRDPDRLVDIAPTESDGRFSEPVLPYRAYTELRERTTTLEDVYGYQLDVGAMSLRGPDGAERIFTTYVTANYFSVLDVHPAIGRLVDRSDSDRPGAAPLAVLSYGFWKRRFNGDPTILGQTLRINNLALTIVGVAADGFHGLSVVVADVWLPLGAAPGDQIDTRLAVGGRLKPGVSLGQAAAEIDGIGRALMRDLPSGPRAMGGLREKGGGGSLRAVRASAVPAVVRVAIYAFLATLIVLASLVLVIACTNVSGVLLARATARRREIAVRLATGAGRARLVRQLMTETTLLFVIGGAAGLALARIMTSLIVLALPPTPVPIDTALPLDGRVIVFTALASLFAAIVSGLVPALQASKADVVSALKAESQSTADRLRLRSLFVVAQVAFSIVLVVTAGLLVRALNRSASVDLGFDGNGVELSTLDLSMAGYTPATGPQFVADLLERIRTAPGVSSATVALSLPLGGQVGMCCGVEVPGVAPPRGEPFFQPAWNVVAPGYFDTLRIRLLAGRDFDATDRVGTATVAIVSEAAARRFWPGESPIGKHIVWQKIPTLLARGTTPAMTPVTLSIVGVAANIASGGSGPRPMVYLPFAQNYQHDLTVVARSTDGRRLTAEIREAIVSANANLPVIAASRLTDQSNPVLTQLRVTAAVSASVGLVALLLAAIGVYGLTAFTVTRRTREIGIRLAMGAQRTDVVRLVLRQGMSLVLIGSAIGLALAAGASRLLVRLLFGVPPLDPVTFGAAALLFAAIGLMACYVPTRRAVRISATEALRYE
jgi:predicted permease